ncbi:MAG: glutaredoxin [Sphingobium sp.]|nr:glutaredoxin [Sphingobium sp.]MBS50146.1 glutaredoxin [Sphingobium sp.]|tara:strand:+ start:245987 stop:246211 length:225 start_codon:yes stop_codon:yes gene_type:complete
MNKIVVYTKDNCKFCTRAKELLESRGLEYDEISFNDPDVLAEFKEKYPMARTAPQILIDGERIGGHTELVQLLG